MSFDPATWQDPVKAIPEVSEPETPLEITKRNLKELSFMLRHPETLPISWDFRCLGGCALGNWITKKKIESNCSIDALRASFPKLGRDAFLNLFGYDSTSLRFYGCDRSGVTPAMVADKIDEWLASH